MSASKFLRRKIWSRLSYTQEIAVLSLVVLFVYALLSVSGFIEYKYFSARKAEAECDRLFEEKDFENSAKECYKSAGYWYNQNVQDKAVKAARLNTSHMAYLAGLDAFQKTEWEEAMELLSKVALDDPDYSDSVEKIATARKELALLEKDGRVAGTKDGSAVEDESQNNTNNKSALSNTTFSQQKKPTATPKIDAETKKKISSLEGKIAALEKSTKTPTTDSLTLSLSQSQIKAVVEVVCIVDFVDVNSYNFSAGSGTIYDPNGYIFTNRHVVANTNGSVTPYTFCAIGITNNISSVPDFKYWAYLYGYSPTTDVADLVIYEAFDGVSLPTSFPYLTIGSSDTLSVGNNIWVAGYPTTGDGTFTLTKGIVSGRANDAIKTDAAISYGNSGGAAIDKNKNYVGIPTGARSEGLGTVGYIIGIDQVLNLTDWRYS